MAARPWAIVIEIRRTRRLHVKCTHVALGYKGFRTTTCGIPASSKYSPSVAKPFFT